jgi:hypothetical protein
MKYNSLLLVLLCAFYLVSCNNATSNQQENAQVLSAQLKDQDAHHAHDGHDHHDGHNHDGHNHDDQSLKADQKLANIEFDNDVFDFGEILEGKQVEHTFTFTNTGEVPLIISGVNPSCGCTSSDYTKEPVAPNEKGTITLTFDSKGKSGSNKKSTSVSANVPGGTVQIYMQGMVKQQLDGPFRK